MPRVRVISFDLWDTVLADDSDEPKRRQLRLPSKPVERRDLVHGFLWWYVEKLEADRDPHRKDLRWQLDIDGDVLSGKVRQFEFRSWINKVVLPRAAGA